MSFSKLQQSRYTYRERGVWREISYQVEVKYVQKNVKESMSQSGCHGHRPSVKRYKKLRTSGKLKMFGEMWNVSVRYLFHPFAQTKVENLRAGKGRPSGTKPYSRLRERYKGRYSLECRVQLS